MLVQLLDETASLFSNYGQLCLKTHLSNRNESEEPWRIDGEPLGWAECVELGVNTQAGLHISEIGGVGQSSPAALFCRVNVKGQRELWRTEMTSSRWRPETCLLFLCSQWRQRSRNGPFGVCRVCPGTTITRRSGLSCCWTPRNEGREAGVGQGRGRVRGTGRSHGWLCSDGYKQCRYAV